MSGSAEKIASLYLDKKAQSPEIERLKRILEINPDDRDSQRRLHSLLQRSGERARRPYQKEEVDEFWDKAIRLVPQILRPCEDVKVFTNEKGKPSREFHFYKWDASGMFGERIRFSITFSSFHRMNRASEEGPHNAGWGLEGKATSYNRGKFSGDGRTLWGRSNGLAQAFINTGWVRTGGPGWMAYPAKHGRSLDFKGPDGAWQAIKGLAASMSILRRAYDRDFAPYIFDYRHPGTIKGRV